jgi:DNA-binding transcriptional ArsR family regulator
MHVADLLEVTDPRAMRALAHPLRLRILRLLQQDGPATATSLAAACDESSGATSFHLRQLAKYGFIQDLPDRGGPRERWWQARARAIHFDTGAPGAGAPELETAAALLRSRVLDQNAETLATYLDSEPDLDPAWRDVALFANTTAYLSVEEMRQLSRQVVDLLRSYARPDGARRPPGAGRVRFVLYGLPEVPRPPSTPRRRRAHSAGS